MNIDEFKRLSILLERVIHKYSQIEQKPWDYGNGILLSRPEIHTIMLINNYPGISVTALAQKRGITKGAASQLLYKMADKGLIEKRISPDSDAQISLYLTELGREVNFLHDKHHKNDTEAFANYLLSLPDETISALTKVMEHFDQALDERLKNIKK